MAFKIDSTYVSDAFPIKKRLVLVIRLVAGKMFDDSNMHFFNMSFF